MGDAGELEGKIKACQAACTRQGDTVRSLKASLKEGKADKADVDAAILELKNLKIALDAAQKEFTQESGKAAGSDMEAFREQVVNTLERRLFFLPSFKIYGAVAGFYDFGPPGCALKANITALWRQHFVLEENMLEVECPAVTPEPVLRASGHVERFTDFMVTDALTGDCHRADHLLEAALEAAMVDAALPAAARKEAHELLVRVGELGAPQLGEALTRYGVKAPDTGNDIGPPFPFNLMFRTSIGPRGDQVGYLRPETAQGIFVNFRDLLYYNGSKLPFAAAQIGQSYRNEIAPRAGLLRVREFTQAEIEHFCHPDDKRHPKFGSVAELAPLLYSQALQMGDEKAPRRMALGEAVSKGIIANETLGYFIGRSYMFLKRIGVTDDRMRFRQHLKHEMAHYADDCWDAEVECSYGWVECAGLADRSAFDLRAHTVASKVDLVAHEVFPEPRMEEQLCIAPNKKELGKVFKKAAKGVQDALEAMCEADALSMRDVHAAGQSVPLATAAGEQVQVAPGMVDVRKETKKVTGRNFVPSVIEPSFGIGRIMYCLLEHCFYMREEVGGGRRAAFRFPPAVAPIKATVFPLLQREVLNERAQKMAAALTKAGLANTIDTTGTTIGKRYARTDEVGVPFAITIDYKTVDGDGGVTLRERDSMAQVRVPEADVPGLLRRLTDMEATWQQVAAQYPSEEKPKEDE